MHNNRPTLSVVVPNYNYAEFLPDALDSVLAQRESFLDIIVVDDGSTDGSRQVLDRYRDRVTVIEQENTGQIGACLKGLSATTADYVYFLDADDYVDQSFAATVLPALHSLPVKVQFQLESVDREGQSFGSVFPAYPQPYVARQMCDDNRTMGFYQCPPTSGNVFRIAALQTLDLHKLIHPPYIDAMAALVMPHLGEVVTIPQRLSYYRIHGSNISSWGNPTPELLRTELEVFHSNWREAIEVLDLDEPPFGTQQPLYVAERELMLGALENDGSLLPRVWRYVRQLWTAHLPARNKVLLTGWAIGLLPPLPGHRRSLVRKRRSPLARSRLLQSLMNQLLHRGAASTSRSQTLQTSKPRTIS